MDEMVLNIERAKRGGVTQAARYTAQGQPGNNAGKNGSVHSTGQNVNCTTLNTSKSLVVFSILVCCAL